MTPTITAPDQTDHARELIEIWMSFDVEAQDRSLARLIAATIHNGAGSALERFAATGLLDGERALDESNQARVPLEHEAWLDALVRFVISRGGDRT